jgi:hypothetical protein
MAVPQDLPGKGAYYTRLSIGPYKKTDAFKQATFDTKLVVHLPLPTEMRDDTTVSYTNVNLETVGDAFLGRGSEQMVNAAVLRNIGNLTSAGLSAAGRGFTGALSGRGAGPELMGALGGAFMNTVQSLLPAEQVASAIQQKTGAAPNPNPSVQFQGPVLRDFTLSWAFYPKNAQESETINDLIKKLKGRALPSNNDGNGGAILNYPHVCQLNFFPWDGKGAADEINGWTESSIIKIKKCFMSGVNVNYNAFGTPGFFEGTQLPISYQLTISFKEIEYLLSDDWDLSAAAERQVASVRAGDVVGTAVNLAFNTGVDVVIGTFNAVKELVLDNVPDKKEQDNLDRGEQVLRELKPGDTDSKVTFTMPGGTTYTTTKNTDGQYVLTTTYPSVGDGGGGPRVTPDPTTTNFDSYEALLARLEEEKVLQDGTQTNPPLPAAAAAAP